MSGKSEYRSLLARTAWSAHRGIDKARGQWFYSTSDAKAHCVASSVKGWIAPCAARALSIASRELLRRSHPGHSTPDARAAHFDGDLIQRPAGIVR